MTAGADSLPIDIYCGKLLDWLISRRHCEKEWLSKSYAVREKIKLAIQDMPEHAEILQLLSGTYINYFHCRRIVEILKETEADSKNFLGRYSSKRMKDWQEVVRLYESDSVYLAEAAQILQRLVQYEECGRKEVDLGKQSKEAERAFGRECEKMGIAARSQDSVRTQLIRLSDGLPEFLNKLAVEAKKLTKARVYYAAFRQYTLSLSEPETDLLAVLQYVESKGNTTVYEWKHGKAPKSIEHFKLQVDEEVEEGEIDFGDAGDIDFGGAEDEAIDFGSFTVEGSGAEGAAEGAAEASDSDGVARGLEALSVLENGASQAAFLRDLGELGAFLRLRRVELGSDSAADLLLSSQSAQFAMPKDADQSLAQVEQMAADVKSIQAQMSDKYRRHLLSIRSSPVYLDRLVREVEAQKGLSSRYASQATASAQRGSEARESALEMGPKLALLLQKTKELQKQVEGDISKRYNNRKVNIMGGASALK